jgi:beta-lactamase superfamily II metal-dependent hydrolase
VKLEDYIESKMGLWRRELIKSTDVIKFEEVEFRILSPDESRLKLLLKKWQKEKPESLETTAKETDYTMSLKEHIQNDKSFEEDKAVHNGSSISFIMSLVDKKMLFLADAHPSVLIASLTALGYSKKNPLVVDFVKLSHHGSMFNTNREFFELINSKKYIISTNGDKHAHPHKRLLARLINQHHDCELYFNYPELIDKIFSEQDKNDFPEVKFIMSNNL